MTRRNERRVRIFLFFHLVDPGRVGWIQSPYVILSFASLSFTGKGLVGLQLEMLGLL